MRFQSVYPNAADVLAASREELAIGMLPMVAAIPAPVDRPTEHVG